MIGRGKKSVLGVMIDAVDYDAAVQRILQAAHTRQPYSVTALAVHGVMTGALDDAQRWRLNHLDLVVPDGQPVRWTLNRLYNTQLPDRVYGPTLMLKLCERAAREGLSIYLYGSEPHILNALENSLAARFGKSLIAGTQPSRFRQLGIAERDETMTQIRDSGASLVFVGLGCPRQEVWVYENRDLIRIPVIAVGAAFDFLSGTRTQAPAWMQKRGLEWLYRLAQEPRRLWKRYLLLNPYFVALAIAQALGQKRSIGTPPTNEHRYG